MAILISYSQLKMIHKLAKEQGMDNDLLHEYVYAQTKARSLRQLTKAQAITLIDKLSGKGGGQGMMTYKQGAYIQALARQLGWIDQTGATDQDRLGGFIRERFKADSIKWLTASTASKVIEALKAMKEREDKANDIQKRN